MLQSGLDEDAAMLALGREMQSRSRWLQQREEEARLGPREFFFTPDPDWRTPLVIEIALRNVLGTASDYWALCPSLIE
jgi:hypothetical protein